MSFRVTQVIVLPLNRVGLDLLKPGQRILADKARDLIAKKRSFFKPFLQKEDLVGKKLLKVELLLVYG